MKLRIFGSGAFLLLASLALAAQPQSEETTPELNEIDGPSLRWVAEDGGMLPFVDDDEVLEFLRTAEMVKRETIDKGVTRPKLLLLEKNGVRARAIFHDVDISKDRQRLASGETVNFFRDSYHNNVAAYELGRLLGLDNIPPVVIRKIRKAEGSVQLWIEQSYDETQRKERGARGVLPVEVRRRVADMWVFDNLINNIDRNEGNMLYDSASGFWWIDHTRTFSRAKQLPSPDRIKRCSRSLLAAIRALDKTEVTERLSPYLSSFAIDSLFDRRDLLVEYLDEMVASKGEEVFLFTYE